MANNYTSGNCTWWVAHVLSWVPNGWGDAKDWWPNAQKAGFAGCQQPAQDSIAVWDGGIDPGPPGQGGFGHVAVVKATQPDGSFVVEEMNWKGLGVVDTRTVKDRSHLLGFIYPKGKTCGGGSSGSSGSSDLGVGNLVTAIQGAGGLLISAGQVAGGGVLIALGLGVAAVMLITPSLLGEA